MKNLNATTKHKLFGIFLGSLVIGAIFTNWYLQQYQPFLDRAYLFLQREFRQQLGVHLQARVTHINFLQLTVTLESINCTPIDDSQWSFQTQKLTLSCSLLTWLYHKKIGLSLNCYNGHIFTKKENNSIAFLDYLKKLFSTVGASAPFSVQSIQFYQTIFELSDTQGSLTITSNGQLGYARNRYSLRMYLIEGTIKDTTKVIAQKITGTVTSNFPLAIGMRANHTIEAQCLLLGLPETKQHCLISGSWTNNTGIVVMHNHDYSFHIDPLTLRVHNNQFCLQGLIKIPFSLAAYLTNVNNNHTLCSGDCVIKVDANSTCCSGTMQGTNIIYNTLNSDSITVDFSTNYTTARGTIKQMYNKKTLSGIWNINLFETTGTLTLINNSDYNLDSKGYWTIPVGAATATINVEKDIINSNYDCTIKQSKSDTQLISSGTITYDTQKIIKAVGHINNNPYNATLETFPFIKPVSLSYHTHEGKPLIIISTTNKDATELEGTISFDCIKALAHELFDYDLSTTGTIKIAGSYDDTQLNGTFKSENGLIRVPEIYNFITDLSGTFHCSFNPLKCSLHNTIFKLHKGTITFSKAEILFNSDRKLENGLLEAECNNCFLHWKNDFLTLVSGNCTLQKQKNTPYQLTGSLSLEKGQLKENPLSQKGQQELTTLFIPSELFENNDDVNIDLTIKTKEPLTIKTPQLYSRAQIDLTISGSLKKLETSGGVQLLSGEIQFPYQSLYITRAQLQCLKDQPYDPLIDLTAQGMIKKYMITLTVTGSLQHPHISLSSIPLLTEEQIISLLFTGSSYESLTIMIPALVMHSIESYLFSAVKKTKIDHWFDPLKHIRIIPSFADQTGRGGFKGAIEIDMSDHLHAKLQKNFSLSEDTAIEIEYLVSDEISIKALKDERSDIGAEIEMRFKF